MKLTINDTTQSLEDWALDYGIPVWLIRERLALGWSEDRAVTVPMHTRPSDRLTDADLCPRTHKPHPTKPAAEVVHGGLLHFDGKEMTVPQWAQHLGISRQVIRYRLRQGYPLNIALDGSLRSGKRPPASIQ